MSTVAKRIVTKPLRYARAVLLIVLLILTVETLPALLGTAAISNPLLFSNVIAGMRLFLYGFFGLTLLVAILCSATAGPRAAFYRRTFYAFGLAGWFVFGLTLVFLGMYGGKGLTRMPALLRETVAGKQHPLGNITGIVAAPDGRICLASQKYDRIEVYDDGGDYVTGWFVSTSGRLHIWLEDGLLHTYQFRVHLHDVFSLNGERVSQERVDPRASWLDNVSRNAAGLETQTPSGNRLQVTNAHSSPRVLQVGPSGEMRALIQTPPALTFMTSAYRIRYAILSWIMSAVYFLLLRMEKARSPSPATVDRTGVQGTDGRTTDAIDAG